MILTLIIKCGIGIWILKHDSDFEFKNASLDITFLIKISSVELNFQQANKFFLNLRR
jgi:hypothetical protein